MPVLVDGDLVIVNSPDILAYLDRRFPDVPLYPAEPRAYAETRVWERVADQELDAILTVIGNWTFADLPPMPEGLQAAAGRDTAAIYDRLEAWPGAGRAWFGGAAPSAADFALYPQVGSGMALGVPLNRRRHPRTLAWLKALRATPAGQSDLAAARAWWATRATRPVDTLRINWGTFRLEWLLANGHADWFESQVRAGKVLWSVGPHATALMTNRQMRRDGTAGRGAACLGSSSAPSQTSPARRTTATGGCSWTW